MIPDKKYLQYVVLIIILTFAVVAAIINLTLSSHINFDTSLSLLSQQFLHGHISLAPTIELPLGDISKFSGKYYVYFGPFPSIVLMPFIFLFGSQFPQIFLGIISLVFSFYLVFRLSLLFKFSHTDAIWLSIFYTFSTVLLSSSIINISAYQVESLGSVLVLLSVYEYAAKRRPYLIGLCIGFAVLTRLTLVLSVVFFIAEYFQKRLTLFNLIRICIPIVCALIFFGSYNYIRFRSFFETGYTYNITLHSFPLSENLAYGYMNLIHIPTNLYSLFFMSPNPLTIGGRGFVLKFPYLKINPWGLAIWWTSPLFLVFLYKWRNGIYSLSALVSVFLLASPVLLYYSIGFAQVGYRYTLDFLPFILLMLLYVLQRALSTFEKGLILIGVLFNACYMLSPWGLYPLFGIFK